MAAAERAGVEDEDSRVPSSVLRIGQVQVTARPAEPHAEPPPQLPAGEELATELQTMFMSSLSSRFQELLPSNFHAAYPGGTAPGEQPLTKRQASRSPRPPQHPCGPHRAARSSWPIRRSRN